jgi:hypothetical protein
MTLTRTRRSSRRSQGRAFREKRCAPGRHLPLLGPPGHGGVGALAVPAARRTGRAPPRSAPGARTAKAPSSRRSSVKPGRDHPQGRFASHVMAYGHPCG